MQCTRSPHIHIHDIVMNIMILLLNSAYPHWVYHTLWYSSGPRWIHNERYIGGRSKQGGTRGTCPPPLPEPLKPCKNMLSILWPPLLDDSSKTGKPWSHYSPNIIEWIEGSFMDYNATCTSPTPNMSSSSAYNEHGVIEGDLFKFQSWPLELLSELLIGSNFSWTAPGT